MYKLLNHSRTVSSDKYNLRNNTDHVTETHFKQSYAAYGLTSVFAFHCNIPYTENLRKSKARFHVDLST